MFRLVIELKYCKLNNLALNPYQFSLHLNYRVKIIANIDSVYIKAWIHYKIICLPYFANTIFAAYYYSKWLRSNFVTAIQFSSFDLYSVGNP